MAPGEFIPLAEELNIADRIDAVVLRTACVQGRSWVDAGFPPLRMAVNLSGKDLDHPGLVASVARTLEETGFSPANLELELTESVVIAESETVLTTLKELKALGLNLSIDDFGTGYSALSRLRALPFDNLKVDKLFVDELAAAPPGTTLAETILDMARVLDLKVIAEGVESSVQAEYLRIRGCEFAQGYLFSRPIPPAEFEKLLRAGAALRAAVASVAQRTSALGVIPRGRPLAPLNGDLHRGRGPQRDVARKASVAAPPVEAEACSAGRMGVRSGAAPQPARPAGSGPRLR